MNDQSKKQIAELLFLALENEITQEQIVALNSFIKNHPERLRYAVNYLQINSALKFSRSVSGMQTVRADKRKDYDVLTDFFDQMAAYEKIAPEIDVPEAQPQQELVQKVIYPPREKRKLTKFGLFTFINAAAVILFLIILRFVPQPGGTEVATLTDSIDAKWVYTDSEMEKGMRLTADGEELLLREGYAEIEFDTNAKLVVQAPAEFKILTKDQIDLYYGRVYAIVPHGAIGFSVNTPTVRVIDLGTEFGVDANFNGDVNLHVMKGKTALIAGPTSSKTSTEVIAGRAKKISGATQDISDTPFSEELFVRDVDSESNFVWKGQTKVNLADIVGGGDGFGSGFIGKGVDLSNGKLQSEFTGSGVLGTAGYIAVPELAFVDGVFVPDARSGDVAITSQGHIFKECPETKGKYFDGIRNGGMINKVNQETAPMELNGQRCGTPENPVLYMHTNAGITFDLDAIRHTMPGYDIKVFSSICGIQSNIETNSVSKADIFVLVDGQLRKSAPLNDNIETVVEIDIQLTKADRFLTLVSTDGGNGIASDWVLFTQPYLSFKPTE